MPGATSSKQQAVRRVRPIAASVAGLFLLGGVCWIVASEILLYHFVTDEVLIATIETAKGWAFVTMAALGVYAITYWTVRDLARSEATTAAILNSLGEGVFVIGTDHRICIANAAAARILEVAQPSELVGMGPEEFSRRYNITDVNGRFVPPGRYVSQRALTGERPPPYKAFLHPPSGGTVIIISTAAPVQASVDGPIEGSVSVMHDITQLEQLDVLRDQFFASAAHALKTPITVIKAQLDILEMASDVSPRSLQMIDRQCGRLERMADAMLTLIRVRTGTLRLYPMRFDCAELVSEVGREMAVASADHPLHTETRAHPIVFGDPERIAQTVRSMIEIAYRRARPHTDIGLALEETDHHATVSVRYEAHSTNNAFGVEDEAGFTSLDVEARLVEALVDASGGHYTSHADPITRTDAVELPTVENPHG